MCLDNEMEVVSLNGPIGDPKAAKVAGGCKAPANHSLLLLGSQVADVTHESERHVQWRRSTSSSSPPPRFVTHTSLGRDTPTGRDVQMVSGDVIALPMVDGLHHRCDRRPA